MSKGIFAIGNALVDIIAEVEDDFLKEQGIQKGIMTLADETEQAVVLDALAQKKIPLSKACGGSACNTAVALANLSVPCIYAGKVSDDENGNFYIDGMKKNGAIYNITPGKGQTGTCLALITKDAQRTLQTNLAIARSLAPEDIQTEQIAKCNYVYIEGYLWDSPKPKEASLKAVELASKNQAKCALTFSDPFLIDRYKDEIRSFVKNSIDIVFCNAEESFIYSGYKEIEKSIKAIGEDANQVFLTAGEEGAYVWEDNKMVHVPTKNVECKDTNGAGDMFAAGVLFGLYNNKSGAESAAIGNKLAGEVVQVIGPRLDVDLQSLIGL